MRLVIIMQNNVDYLLAFTQIVLPVAYEFQPDLVFVSAGFDAGTNDPLGGCGVTPAGFAQMTHLLKSVAMGKLVLVLEGGYNVQTVTDSVVECISVLLGKPVQPPKIKAPLPSAVQTLDQVKRLLAPHWKCMAPFHIPSTGRI